MKIKKILGNILIVIVLVIISLILPVFPKTVNAKVKVKLSSTKLTLYEGRTKALALKRGGKWLHAKWHSSKGKIATVGKNSGVVKGKKRGSCKIIARYAGRKYTCKVTVKKKDVPSNPSYNYDYPSYTQAPSTAYTPVIIPDDDESYYPNDWNNDSYEDSDDRFSSNEIGTINIVGLVNSKGDRTKIETTLPEDYASDTWYLLYTTKDVDGRVCKAEKYNPEKILFMLDPATLVDKQVIGGELYTINGIQYASILINPGSDVAKGSTFTVIAMSTRTGMVSAKNFTISEAENYNTEVDNTFEPIYPVDSSMPIYTAIPDMDDDIDDMDNGMNNDIDNIPDMDDGMDNDVNNDIDDIPDIDVISGNTDSIHYLTPYQTSNIKTYDNDSESFSMMGVKYFQGIAPDSWCNLKIALYNLDTKFDTVSFDVGHWDNQGKEDTELKVYVDNKLIETVTLTSDMATRKITVNVAGAKQLSLKYDKSNAYYGVGNIVGYGGHIYEEQITKIANVKQSGTKTYTCKYCGESYTETIPAQEKCIPYLKPYQASNVKNYEDDGKTYFEVMGKRYYKGIAPNTWSSTKEWIYNLKKSFSNVTFSVGHIDGTMRTDSIMYVYVDGVKVREINLGGDMISEKIRINTSGVTQLKFVYDKSDAYYAVYDMQFNSNIQIEHSFKEEQDADLDVTRYTCDNCGAFYIE